MCHSNAAPGIKGGCICEANLLAGSEAAARNARWWIVMAQHQANNLRRRMVLIMLLNIIVLRKLPQKMALWQAVFDQ